MMRIYYIGTMGRTELRKRERGGLGNGGERVNTIDPVIIGGLIASVGGMMFWFCWTGGGHGTHTGWRCRGER